MSELNTKPCLVQTGQGFSVIYRNKLLYSKYNPAKNILSVVQNTQILPGTIILCFSPVLQYGLQELADKLPENCLMYAVEADSELQNLAESQTGGLKCVREKVLSFIGRTEIYRLPALLDKISRAGKYRRVISIEFSAGSQFNQQLYAELFDACRNSVAQFWKNRVTLVKFGRRYNANLIKNLSCIFSSINSLSVTKPILVVGAGESAVSALKFLNDSKKFFIIAVDAALQTLKSLDIKPDAAIVEECQSTIHRAFIGSRNSFDYLFCSAVANPQTLQNSAKKIFYTPLFYEGQYIENLKNSGIFQNPIKPLGSVGLSAVEMALKIRKNEEIPVFVTGLDFSFSRGQTHAKDSFHEKNRRIKSSKLNSLCVWSGTFGSDSRPVEGKNGKPVITTTALSGYAELFKYRFERTVNLFDAGVTGIPLGIKTIDFKLIQKCEGYPCSQTLEISAASGIYNKVNDWYKTEKSALEELKSILTGKTELPEEERNKQIRRLLESREYLYLHFPDGYCLSLEPQFLKRVRIELDYFLKIFNRYSSRR